MEILSPHATKATIKFNDLAKLPNLFSLFRGIVTVLVFISPLFC